MKRRGCRCTYGNRPKQSKGVRIVAEDAVEVTQKEMGAKDAVDTEENHVAITEGKLDHVESHVFAIPAGAQTVGSGTFTRETFEDALDKVSRPVKGKYAHVPYSSEDLIREKRTETELEDR